MIFRRRRRKRKIIDAREINEDWKPGDLAKCINGTWNPPEPGDPVLGEVLRVVSVGEGTTRDGYLICGLHFEGRDPNRGWSCLSFRKLRPVQEPASDEFTARIRDLCRVPEKVG